MNETIDITVDGKVHTLRYDGSSSEPFTIGPILQQTEDCVQSLVGIRHVMQGGRVDWTMCHNERTKDNRWAVYKGTWEG